MDEETVNDILHNIDGRQFWVVLWGDPDTDPYKEAIYFDDSKFEHWFPINPASIKQGDILFVHRIKFSMLVYVGEVISSARKATREEISKDDRRRRWEWSLEMKNLTPTLGLIWRERWLKTFDLSKEYNKFHPEDKVRLGRLNFGAPTRISTGFAKFLLDKIVNF